LNYKETQKVDFSIYPWKNNETYKGLRKWYQRHNGFLDKNIELHHWSYSDENLRDVILLNRSTHKRLHALLNLSLDKLCFIVKETSELLDTKEKHLKFINENF
jgi:hypothetical protein